MTKWTYEATQQGYANMWDSITIKASDAVQANRFATTIIAHEAQYRAVDAVLGVPWYFVGALHMRESSCNFKGVLHNGEKIIGTGKKTKLVPARRGPFATWQESAIDALRLKQFEQYAGKWCPALMGFSSERFNGLGNVAKGVNSAYLWAGSNHEQLGKYVRDHVFDPNFDDPQIGTMTVLKALCKLRPDIAADMGVKSKMSTKNKVIIAAGGAASTGAVINETTTDASSTLDQLSPIISIFQNYGTTIAVVFTLAVVLGSVAWHFYEKKQGASDVEAGA